MNKAELQHHGLKLAEIGLQTYGRKGADLKQTTDGEKLRLAEAFIRDWQKEFFRLIGAGPYENLNKPE